MKFQPSMGYRSLFRLKSNENKASAFMIACYTIFADSHYKEVLMYDLEVLLRKL